MPVWKYVRQHVAAMPKMVIFLKTSPKILQTFQKKSKVDLMMNI